MILVEYFIFPSKASLLISWHVVHCPVYLVLYFKTNTTISDDIAILPRCYVSLSSPGRKYLFLLKMLASMGWIPKSSDSISCKSLPLGSNSTINQVASPSVTSPHESHGSSTTRCSAIKGWMISQRSNAHVHLSRTQGHFLQRLGCRRRQ